VSDLSYPSERLSTASKVAPTSEEPCKADPQRARVTMILFEEGGSPKQDLVAERYTHSLLGD